MISDEEAEKIRERLLEQITNLPEEQQEQAETLKKQIENASNEQLEQFVRAQTQRGQGEGGELECIFCQIIEGKLDTVKIYEDAEIIAVLDIYPAAAGHMLIMPKQHFSVIEEIPDALLNKLFTFVKAVVPSFLKVTDAKGFNLFIAQGDSAGQRVKHFCVNLIPRRENDKISFEWAKVKVAKKEIEKLGEKLRKDAEKEMRGKLEVESAKVEKRRREEQESEIEKMMKHVKKRMP